MFIEVRRAMHEQSENFNRDRKYKKSIRTIELKSTITEKFDQGVQQQIRSTEKKDH
jgi:hypothetical protein